MKKLIAFTVVSTLVFMPFERGYGYTADHKNMYKFDKLCYRHILPSYITKKNILIASSILCIPIMIFVIIKSLSEQEVLTQQQEQTTVPEQEVLTQQQEQTTVCKTLRLHQTQAQLRDSLHYMQQQYQKALNEAEACRQEAIDRAQQVQAIREQEDYPQLALEQAEALHRIVEESKEGWTQTANEYKLEIERISANIH
ncbi:MAG: hypothetical protein LBL71_00325 [Endomicrobium sp.]|jgi:hypothetical protein|nr:hypothetical protein [Endomicrobium sp.]